MTTLERPVLKITNLPDESILEQAWRTHEPERGFVPSSIWRRLRAIKAELAPTAVVIENMLRDQAAARTVLEPMIRRRGVARQRLLKELRRVLPAATLRICDMEILEISWLSPKSHIIVDGKAGEDQDCLLACYALAFPPDAKTLTIHSGWALEISDHASARLLQRAPNDDLRAAAQQAALAFVAADASIVRPLIGTTTSVYLQAGSGAFAATVIGGMTQTGKAKIYARCRTFVPASWLKPDHVFAACC
jgi:sarcosine oxidase gamma subunit